MLKFERKLFFAILVPSLFLTISSLLFLFNLYKTDLNNDFLIRYKSSSQTVIDSLLQLENLQEQIAINAAYVLFEYQKINKLPHESELRELAKKLKVSFLYITNKDGYFLRSTENLNLVEGITLFSHCGNYRNLTYGNSNLEVTPIIRSNPYNGPLKFIMIPNFDRSSVLEVGMHFSSIGDVLMASLKSDKNLARLAIYTPNGESLGSTEKINGVVNDNLKVDPEIVLKNPIVYRDGKMILTRKIPIAREDCCECKVKTLVDGDGKYFYILETIVSLDTLTKQIKKLEYIFLFLLIISIIIGYFLSHYLAGHLVWRISQINSGVQKVFATKDLSFRFKMSGKDEITELSNSFDQMIENLEMGQHELIEAEKNKAALKIAEQVAHDIRSPLAALEMITEDLPANSDQKLLVKRSIDRISQIVKDLAIRNSLKGQEVKQITLLSSLINQTVLEKRVEIKNTNNITIQFNMNQDNYGVFSKVEPLGFKRVLSNLINNSIEAIGEKENGLIEILLTFDRGHVAVTIIDNGPGIDEKIKNEIFEQGFSTKQGGGRGLGLFYSKRKIEESCPHLPGSLKSFR